MCLQTLFSISIFQFAVRYLKIRIGETYCEGKYSSLGRIDFTNEDRSYLYCNNTNTVVQCTQRRGSHPSNSSRIIQRKVNSGFPSLMYLVCFFRHPDIFKFFQKLLLSIISLGPFRNTPHSFLRVCLPLTHGVLPICFRSVVALILALFSEVWVNPP
jgi:hypothetical protein